MNSIYLHTDDLGITKSSTETILKSWKDGVLESFSLIANGDAIQLATSEINRNADLKARIALHFNLTEGMPISDPNKIPYLVNKDGYFSCSFSKLLFKTLIANKLSLSNQIRLELTNQFNYLQAQCPKRKIEIIDGHNHIQMIPFIFLVVARTAKELGVNEIRISDEPLYVSNLKKDLLSNYFYLNLVKNLTLKLFSLYARRVSKNYGLISVDAIIGLLYSGHMTSERVMSALSLRKFQAKKRIEVIFHIGRSRPEESIRWANASYSDFHLSRNRDIENDELVALKKVLK